MLAQHSAVVPFERIMELYSAYPITICCLRRTVISPTAVDELSLQEAFNDGDPTGHCPNSSSAAAGNAG
jgi:hypothetical protein